MLSCALLRCAFACLIFGLRFCVRYGDDDDGIGITAVFRNSSAKVIDRAAMLLLLQQQGRSKPNYRVAAQGAAFGTQFGCCPDGGWAVPSELLLRMCLINY